MRNLLLSCFGMMPFLQRLLNRGVKPDTPFQIARSVRILNGTAIVLILNAIPFTIAGYLSGDVDIQKANLIINAFTLLAGLTALYLSGIGKWKIGLHFISLFFMGFLLCCQFSQGNMSELISITWYLSALPCCYLMTIRVACFTLY